MMEGKFEDIFKLIRTIGPPPKPRPFPTWKDVKKKKNKVAIVGFSDSKSLAPFKDESFEIWGLNSLFEAIPRYDRWFEIHEREKFNLDTNKEIGYGLTRTGEPYVHALAKMTCPLYMVESYPDIPTSIRYPIEEIIMEFHPMGRPENAIKDWTKDILTEDWNGYFTNSVSYMIALAIYEKYEEIHIYGVDMATSGEYSYQRSSCELYVGIAIGRGIKVFIPNQADLLKNRYLYGYENEKEDRFNSKIDQTVKSMNERYTIALQNRDFAQKQIDQYIGAMEFAKEMRKIWENCKKST
jgi:hypothetical protein